MLEQVEDRVLLATSLVSINPAGTAAGNDVSFDARITPDGRYVAFESNASDLTATPATKGVREVFVRDLTTGTTTLVP